MIKLKVIDNKKFIEIWFGDKKVKDVDKKLYASYLGKIRLCQNEKDLSDLLSSLDEKIALGYVYKLLAVRGYLEGELCQKLTQRKIGEKAIESVLKKCRDAGYLDDERETRLMIERAKKRGQGPMKIKHIVKEKGGIETFVRQFFSEEEQRDQIRRLIAKRFPELSTIKDKQRAFRFFQSRGFSQHLIREIILE